MHPKRMNAESRPSCPLIRDADRLHMTGENEMRITSASTVSPVPPQGPVRRACLAVQRDIAMRCLPGQQEGTDILLQKADLPSEAYCIRADHDRLLIRAGDELGMIYGLYRLSHDLLGIEPFWFWNDQPMVQKEAYAVPEHYSAQSRQAAVRYRGWFINDEVLLHAWKLDGSREKPWEMAFEALLRLGGNLVIPGTDRNAHRYRDLAADFGLYITHHHAEPLGAVMFRRAYPHLTASYKEYPELFEKLWQEAIERQKNSRVVWNLGFRGQGDCPFWVDDPAYDTPQKRGELISSIIGRQYEMVQRAVPGAPCCTNLYGEVMELYMEGCLRLPEDIILVWADNGYGKMVTRRQGNHNPRIRALPQEGSRGAHGVYYHASFYDLQAAAQMTMLPNPPQFVRRELLEAMGLGVTDYWLVNCSNIKPHVYTLDWISALWRDGDADPETHLLDYCVRYYGEDHAAAVADCFRTFYRNAPAYGDHEDEHAGEQFGNHCARMLVSKWMKDASSPAEDMKWAVDAPTLKEQIVWYKEKCETAVTGYRGLMRVCETVLPALEGHGRVLFEDSIMMQARLLLRTYEGSSLAMKSLLYADRKDWLMAFYTAGRARDAYLAADRAMREREHGCWYLFYANDCQADVKQSAWLMGVLMGVLRNLGDGPHFYRWQRRFLDAPEDAGIMLILNMENHLDNDELFRNMQARMERTGESAEPV